jgi:1-acyl-sn-glycerol-3-phosphate acyltransferase
MYFFVEHVHRMTGRKPVTCVADFVFSVPLLSWVVKLGGGIPANRRETLKALQEGGIVIVAPGGVREAMTTTAEDYAVRWFGRSGFADIARQTKATIVPMFTKNIRDVFLVLGGGNT